MFLSYRHTVEPLAFTYRGLDSSASLATTNSARTANTAQTAQYFITNSLRVFHMHCPLRIKGSPVVCGSHPVDTVQQQQTRCRWFLVVLFCVVSFLCLFFLFCCSLWVLLVF